MVPFLAYLFVVLIVFLSFFEPCRCLLRNSILGWLKMGEPRLAECQKSLSSYDSCCIDCSTKCFAKSYSSQVAASQESSKSGHEVPAYVDPLRICTVHNH